jgi:hypothetical protein
MDIRLLREGEPESYITDFDKALAVAYASKNERCLAMAGRLIDKVLEPYVSKAESRTLPKDAEVAEALADIYQRYPEAFRHVGHQVKTKDDKLNSASILNAIPFVLKHGGLPIEEYDMACYRRLVPENLDKEAEWREQIAVALYDTPPSEDFMCDYGVYVHRRHEGRKDRDEVEAVMGLAGSAEYCKERATHFEDETCHLQKVFQDNEYFVKEPKMTRMQFMLSRLERVATEIRLDLKDKGRDYDQEIRDSLNADSTTLNDILALCVKGYALLAEDKLKEAEKHQHAYDAVLSGEASTYKSPNTKRF